MQKHTKAVNCLQLLFKQTNYIFNKICQLLPNGAKCWHRPAKTFHKNGCAHNINKYHQPAFSLVEMLMALLVASLLMAALAPVMTKKFSENVNVSGGMSAAVPMVKRMYEIEYGTDECSVIKTDSDGSEYCEGEYSVPSHFSGNMKVTVIGAGGGGVQLYLQDILSIRQVEVLIILLYLL